jgi:formate dehydrogenase-N alpha subunit
MTNSWTDIKNADLVLIMGGNAAEAHPCGFKWVTEAKHHNKAKLIVVDPRFTRSAAVSDFYCPVRAGTDIAYLLGVINYLISNDKIHRDYVTNYTDMTYVVKEGFSFDEEGGVYSGYDAAKRTYDRSSWEYELGADGFVVTDPTLQNPRTVYQLLKKHVSRYTPEMVSRITGAPKEKFLKVCEMVATTANGERSMTIMYALGWTQHTHGAQNIRCAAMLQLLLGNQGVPGGGVNALRGHSNVQGLTDIGVLAHLTPGYLGIPNEREGTFAAHLGNRNFRPLRANQVSYWQNYKKFYVSLLKSMYGAAAKPENDFGYGWLPKIDKVYDTLQMFEDVHQGKVNGFICQGFNPLLSVPNKGKMTAALSKLKFLVSIDPLMTDTAMFWESHGEANPVDPAKIQTEVFLLPANCFAEDEGSFTNSSRTLNWRWKAADPPGEARTDIAIMADLFLRIRELYSKGGGKAAEPVLSIDWAYKNPKLPTPDELLRELNGKAVTDIADPADAQKQLYKAGQQIASFGHLRDDGSTAAACWIYTGCYSEKGNMTARRDNADPSGRGVHPNWGFAWPANRRVLYNRASADPSGKPWSERKKYVYWDANAKRWTGADVPDYGPTLDPARNAGPFIMTPEGSARFFVRRIMADGPFPEHYEPFESPVANVLHPKMASSPVARVFKGDLEVFGKAKDFPYVATTYRLVEHFHWWTKAVKLNAIVQPEFFVEISPELAKEKGISPGQWVRVFSNRGSVKGKAVITKRMPVLTVDGRKVHTVGMPLHYGFIGETKKAIGVNALTPYVGDANTNTPEYKAFLVDIEPLKSGPAIS